MTKALISESLKILMETHSFEKITIRMITDASGVIRPTFYNYFCDKYEVLEWIFVEEIVVKMQALFDQKMFTEGIKLIFECMKEDRRFYKRAFEVGGQNSFTDIAHKHLHQLFLYELEKSYNGKGIQNKLVSPSLIAEEYSLMLLYMLREYTSNPGSQFRKAEPEELVEAYIYLLTHKVSDYIDL